MKIVYTTTNNKNVSTKIAKQLLKLKLSACVQIISNVDSYYSWDNKIEFSNEYLLVIKTNSKNISVVIKEITNLHNYEIPEVVVVEATISNRKYNDWFNKIMR